MHLRHYALGAATAAALALATTSAQAAFDFVIENGGKPFNPSEAQETALGLDSNTALGLVGFQNATEGSTITASDITSEITSGTISGLLKGPASSLVTYDGPGTTLEELTIEGLDRASDGRVFNAFYVAFDESETIVFSNLGDGTATLSAGNFGDLGEVPADLAPVPLPAAAWLMISGLAGVGYTAYRGRKAAAA
jgi:hypothetical protein